MKKMLLATFVAIAVGGCATHEKFMAKMDRFIGQPEAVLIQTYGPPLGSYTLNDGSKVIQYTRGSTMMIPGATTYAPVTTNTMGNVAINQGLRTTYGTYNQTSTSYVPQKAPDTPISLSCTVNFTIDKAGAVASWSATGNHCVAD